MIDFLGDMFPGASFIHILRDGRSVVHSMQHFRDNADVGLASRRDDDAGWPAWAEDFGLASTTWSRFVAKAMRYGEREPERCLTIRYEQLTEAPEETFARLFRFLEIAPDAAPLDFFRHHHINTSFPRQMEAGEGRPDPWTAWSTEQRRIFLEEAGETMLRYGLVSAHEGQRLLRDAWDPADPACPRWVRHGHILAYSWTKQQVRVVVGEQVPAGAIVLVVSKGDEELLELGEAIGWHFPQLPDGTYAGSYPATGQEVVDQLQELQRRGAGYLVLPEPAFWWLEYYREVATYLGERAQLVHGDDQVRLYRLEGGG
jgi:hypothetical protein